VYALEAPEPVRLNPMTNNEKARRAFEEAPQTNPPITLATLHLAAKQQVFDQVLDGMLVKKKLSVLRCLSSDEEFRHLLEGCPWFTLVDCCYVASDHDNFIGHLHDIFSKYYPGSWMLVLKGFSRAHGLTLLPNLPDYAIVSHQEIGKYLPRIAKDL